MNMCTRGCENRNVQGSYCMLCLCSWLHDSYTVIYVCSTVVQQPMANCLVCVAMATRMGVAVGWGDFSGSPSLLGEQASCHCERDRESGKEQEIERSRHLNSNCVKIADIDARPWDFQAEECALRESIEKFNSRRYERNRNGDFAPVDNCLQSVLGQRVELPEDFHYSYEMWLEREVFSQPIQWEGLLQNP